MRELPNYLVNSKWQCIVLYSEDCASHKNWPKRIWASNLHRTCRVPSILTGTPGLLKRSRYRVRSWRRTRWTATPNFSDRGSIKKRMQIWSTQKYMLLKSIHNSECSWVIGKMKGPQNGTAFQALLSKRILGLPCSTFPHSRPCHRPIVGKSTHKKQEVTRRKATAEPNATGTPACRNCPFAIIYNNKPQCQCVCLRALGFCVTVEGFKIRPPLAQR